MLTKDTVFQISREGYELLRNTKGNNGRVLRRFLTRVSSDGLVLQVFTDYGTDLSPDKLALYAAYAEKVRATSIDDMPDDYRSESKTIVDKDFSLVENSYWMHCDIATASVNELRGHVCNVIRLSDRMHKFAANPSDELHTVSPEAAAEHRAALEVL